MKAEVTRQDVIYYMWHFGAVNTLREVTRAAGKTRKLKQLKKDNSGDILIGTVIDEFLSGYFTKDDAKFMIDEVARLEHCFRGDIQ